jgi:alpha-L-fucosidase
MTMHYDQDAYLQKIDAVIAQGPYSDNWESLSAHETPRWFRDDKLGIFIHWGAYSVPAFGNEWYSRQMYVKGTPEYDHHIATYGPQKDFGYKDFIPMFRGEHFDAARWISLFKTAGARFVVPVAEHHDGFQMYRSALSHWNAYEMGPKRDVLGELTQEMERQGLVNGASSHRIEHWFFQGQGREFESDIPGNDQPGDLYWPSVHMENNDKSDSFEEPQPDEAFLNDWLIRTVEIIDRYRPKELYFDWWIHVAAARPYLQKLAAYYYNRAAEWGEEVLICYKHDSFMFGTAVPDVERGQYADICAYPWESDTAIGKNSWGYTRDNEYKKYWSILCDFVDTISKNGTMLLNVGPKPDGTFTEEDTRVLEEIGDWMRTNAEAVYGSRPWKIFGEGPTREQEGQFTDRNDKIYTAEDFRFVVNHGRIYAAAMRFPESGDITIRSLAAGRSDAKPDFAGIVASVRALGYEEKPVWEQKPEGLVIHAPFVHSDAPVFFAVSVR